MFIISTRQIEHGNWTYDKVSTDEPQYYQIPDLTKLEPAALQALTLPIEAIQAMVDEAKAKMPSRPMIVVFVHGYNNSVNSAVDRTRAIEDALVSHHVSPAMACLSWSTDAKIQNYLQDRSDARASALVVSRVLHHFKSHDDIASGRVALNFVVHSMGNYLMNLACESMDSSGNAPASLFHHSILVAADINQDDLNVGQEGDLHCRLSSHVTFYYSGWDGTLEIAEMVLNRQRFGKYGPHQWDRLHPNTLGVNCSDVIRAHTSEPIDGAWQVGVNVHSAYFSNTTFQEDLAQTLLGSVPDAMNTRRHPDGLPANSYRLKNPS